jgi:hypothetical protein
MDGCPDCEHYEFHLGQLRKLVDRFDKNLEEVAADLMDTPSVRGMRMIVDKVRRCLPV